MFIIILTLINSQKYIYLEKIIYIKRKYIFLSRKFLSLDLDLDLDF